jgi:muramoyltetrapeptide carboxypeptidase
LLGQFTDCKPSENTPSLTLDEVFEDYFGKLKIPVLKNLPFGHIKRQWTVPLGAKMRIEDNSVSIIESVLS